MTAVNTGYPLTSITWPYRGLRCRPIEVKYFFEVIRWQGTGFQMIAGSSLIFLKFIWNMLCLCAAQLKFWFQTDLGRENSASYYRQGRQLLLTLLAMITRWSRSSSNFYAVIGQNLTGEFMRRIYAASWIKTFQRIFSRNSGCKRKLWAIFLPRVHLWKESNTGKP